MWSPNPRLFTPIRSSDTFSNRLSHVYSSNNSKSSDAYTPTHPHTHHIDINITQLQTPADGDSDYSH
jgi:hypothetical protein